MGWCHLSCLKKSVYYEFWQDWEWSHALNIFRVIPIFEEGAKKVAWFLRTREVLVVDDNCWHLRFRLGELQKGDGLSVPLSYPISLPIGLGNDFGNTLYERIASRQELPSPLDNAEFYDVADTLATPSNLEGGRCTLSRDSTRSRSLHSLREYNSIELIAHHRVSVSIPYDTILSALRARKLI